MNILEELKTRGILKQVSNEQKFLNLNPKTTGVYVGFDPSASSLHLGNYILISVLKRFKLAGYQAYAVIGGATGMIGDPSFKDAERKLLTNKEVVANRKKIRKQLESFGLDILDNYDIYRNMNVLEFLRDAGKLVNVSYMMAKESVQKRIERGLSFTEFSYQVLQGFDFLTFYTKNNVKIQVGGSDQWGNITTGLDMITKVHGDNHQAVALTVDLLTDSEGNKIGKSTGGGGLWLDKNLCSPYRMYQYLLNLPDSLVQKALYWLTFLDIKELDKIVKKHNQNPAEHYAQKVLAQEVTRDIFGDSELTAAKNITEILFNKNYDFSVLNDKDVQSIEPYLKVVEIKKNDNLIDVLIKEQIIQSKREAREFINTNALKIDDQNVNEETIYGPKYFKQKYAFFRKGKKQTILLKTKK